MTNKERVLSKAMFKHLYWGKKFSTHKIARVFNTHPQSVRRLAIKYRIKLRLPKGSQKEKYKISKKLLEDLYLKQKLSIPQITKKLGIKSYSTVWLKLLQNSISIRSMSEAKTKYQKFPFSQNLSEKAYLIGLRTGDISANRDWLRVVVTTSTTHPAQIEMMKSAFNKYGRVYVYIHKDKRGIKEFKIQCGLNQTFDFLLTKITKLPKWIMENKNCFFSFLAGYSDCEANWNISKRYTNSFQIDFNLRTNDKDILKHIKSKLVSEGFNPYFRLYIKKGQRATYGIYTKDLYSLRIGRRQETIRLAKILLPLSKHGEKIDKMKLVIGINKNTEWDDIENKVLSLRKSIKNIILKQDNRSVINDLKK